MWVYKPHVYNIVLYLEYIYFIYLHCEKYIQYKENILISNYHNRHLKYLFGLYKFFFIAVLVSSQHSGRSCICMLRVSILPLSTIF